VLVVVFACDHTPLYKTWLAVLRREFDKTKWSIGYKIELGLLADRQTLTVYQTKSKYMT